MLVSVAPAALGVAWWMGRIVADPLRFADAVAPLPAHPIVRRAVRRRVPSGLGPIVDRALRTTAAQASCRRLAVATHRRARRSHRRAALVGIAALAAIATTRGRRRLAVGAVAAGAMALALHVVVAL